MREKVLIASWTCKEKLRFERASCIYDIGISLHISDELFFQLIWKILGFLIFLCKEDDLAFENSRNERQSCPQADDE